ncbi:MAG: PAS domain S-box protein [Desulfobacteraceae bacterium]|nr:PAS domain S-box protein [Desulfobacteraceae bacterium]
MPAPIPLLFIMIRGYPEYINEAFTTVFHWHLNELRDQLIPFVPEDQKQITKLKIKKIYRYGNPVRFETKRISKSGKIIDILLGAALIKGIEGIHNGLVVSLKDITERKDMEVQIQQTQEMESIGTLAGGIAHDFNNILFPVLGHTEMLLHDIPEDNPIHNNLKKIYAGANRAKELVKQILAFSRQEAIKIQPLIKEVLKLIRATIPTTIEIRHDIRSGCGTVKADPTQIHQIVMNLTTNAYHAMEESGGELKVTLKEVDFNEDDLINPDNLL